MEKQDDNPMTTRPIAPRGPKPKEAVAQLDQRILRCVDPAADDTQKTEMLAWIHHHLMVPVIIEWDRPLSKPQSSEEAARAMEEPSLACIDVLRLLLNGAVAIDENFVFRVLIPPPPGYKFVPDRSAKDFFAPTPAATGLVAWFHRRLTHAAQRTRFHDDSELKALLEWADAELLMYAVRRFGLSRYLSPEPLYEGAPAMPAVLMTVARGNWSISWTGNQPVFQVLTPPVFN